MPAPAPHRSPLSLFAPFSLALCVARVCSGVFGFGLNSASILWCTFNATRFIEAMSERGREQRYLFAYPIGLLYACFALLTVF